MKLLFTYFKNFALGFILLLNSCGGGGKATSPVEDPLYGQQWFLNNTGQNAYSRSSATSGVDLNLAGITQTGNGVIVNIVDSGLELEHEDLAGNIISGSVNFLNDSGDPTNLSTEGDHGTSIAGIIAAIANNGKGGRGIAYNSKLIAHNYIADQNSENLITAISAARVAINNHSYITPNRQDKRIASVIADAYKNGVDSGRNGRGIIYIKSAGNDFEPSVMDNIKLCEIRIGGQNENVAAYYTTEAITCTNANLDPVNTIPYNIVVSAVNAEGEKASYANTGAAILISGLGGEDGRRKPAIITTDQSGCQKGYARNTAQDTTFDRGQIPEINLNCNYTNKFNGTSAAAATVSGVTALLLEANIGLSWRDVRHIFISTARKVDANKLAIKTKTNIPEIISDATVEHGWVTNEKGYSFHNWYGFGLIDANAAVNMATGYNSPLGVFKNFTSTNDTEKNIPDKNVTGATNSINFTQNITIESLQVDLEVTHQRTGDLAVWLISPSRTQSILLNPFNQFITDPDSSNDTNLDLVLASQAFYGEKSGGTWDLKIIDYRQEKTGSLINWSLTIYGY